jgi:fermentation-respiration switch protein FrsA (DUF1100 family)
MLTDTEQSVSFVSEGLTLSGVLHLPMARPLAVIIGCHGLMADKNSPKQIELARNCTAAGMAYFRFDHRGCGESEGVFEKQTTLENRSADLIAAARTAKKAIGTGTPIGLFGSSLGGTVCLVASHRVNPFAMVTLAAPVETKSIRIPPGSPASLKDELLANRLIFDITDRIRTIHHLMVIHGSGDETVPVANAQILYRLAKRPKKKIIFKNGDHRISKPAHQERFLEAAVQWFTTCYRDQIRVSRPPGNSVLH